MEKLRIEHIYAARLDVQFKDLTHRLERAGYNNEQDLVVTFTVCVKAWNTWRKNGQLGQVYNTDLSNYLCQKGVLKHYAIPSVDDSRRAVLGRKSITVRFGGF